MTLEIYLVRHGESEINEIYRQWSPEERKVCGRNQWSELTETGIEQSRKLGEFLSGKCFSGIYSSPAVRAQQTARYCLQAMQHKWPKYETDDRLSELGQGEWEGQLDSRVRPPHVWEEIKAQNWEFKPLHGETQSEVYERMRYFIEDKVIAGYLDDCEAVRKYMKEYSRKDLIFTHKNAIACLLAPVMGYDLTKVHEMDIRHTSITLIRYHRRLEESEIWLNMIPHLEACNG
ncbi:histidine phosphatase family protein [Candidatus Woesearchaeota archaeon]|nr:histidine phosphatase family protein [Candidatus Woesearchaeota archaeon]